MKRPRFISLEGGEGVGKSTQLRALATRFQGRGVDVITTREPGGSPGAEAIRDLLLSGKEQRWTPAAEALLFAAARADHVANTIRPALDAGRWVLSDRFLDSSLAYQGAGAALGMGAIRQLHAFGSDNFLPDRTLVLQLPTREGMSRAGKRDGGSADRIGGRSGDYHASVEVAFAQLANEEANRVRLVDASGSENEVTERLLTELGGLAVILGQDRAVDGFTSAMRSGALHHAWLLSGPRGVGKAHFAREAATRLLAEASGPPIDGLGLATPPEHPIARLMAAGSHPDFRHLERLERPTGGMARSITVDQVRGLGELFERTPFISTWRAVVIDAADDLEPAGANALLKMLEEPPPNCLFLLVAHAAGRLLPTIRSRCRRLDFDAVNNDAMATVLRQELPSATDDEIRQLVPLAGGSVGRALAYAGLDLAPLEAEALHLLRNGDPTNARRAKLVQGLSGKAAADRYTAFLQLVPGLISREARALEGDRRLRALDAYANARETAALAPRLSLDPAATVFQLGSILASVP